MRQKRSQGREKLAIQDPSYSDHLHPLPPRCSIKKNHKRNLVEGLTEKKGFRTTCAFIRKTSSPFSSRTTACPRKTKQGKVGKEKEKEGLEKKETMSPEKKVRELHFHKEKSRRFWKTILEVLWIPLELNRESLSRGRGKGKKEDKGEECQGKRKKVLG